jgi:hypothetical protein
MKHSLVLAVALFTCITSSSYGQTGAPGAGGKLPPLAKITSVDGIEYIFYPAKLTAVFIGPIQTLEHPGALV